MTFLSAALRGPVPRGRLASLGMVLLLLLPSASSEEGLGGLPPGSPERVSFRVTLTSGRVLAGVPQGRARAGKLVLRTSRGELLSLPAARIRRMEPLPAVRVVLPGRKRRFPWAEARARRWARLLLSPRGADRDRAEKALIALGRPVRPYLYKIFWTGPPEASLRAARALRRIAASPWGPPQRRNMLE